MSERPTIGRDSGFLPELLAPAGTFEHLKAAVKAGADAVYMGGSLFGARAYAGNLSEEELADALHYVHFHGKRLYLTVNTLLTEKELNTRLYGFLMPYYEAGLDGVIVQDLGTASFIHERFPDMEIHGSTQMAITHKAGALAARRLGMNRIVPARELSIEEWKSLKDASGLEIEVFIHGALCFSYSGQCLLSSYYGGRSGNRGRCAQPCRLPYRDDSGKEAFYMSMRDLSTLPILPSLLSAGVDSLKIEGRMKNVDYVAGVTSIYRKYLDLSARLRKEGRPDQYKVDPEDEYSLQELYCRGDFTEGYVYRHNGRSMMALHTQKNLGRKIGSIRQIKKHQIRVRLLDSLAPGDLLVLPLKGDQEMVLTVPSDNSQTLSSKDDLSEVCLNVPTAKPLKAGMPVYRRRSEQLSRRIHDQILDRKDRFPVTGQVWISQGAPSRVTLTSDHVTVTIEGSRPQEARNRALTREDVSRQFEKTGETPFFLNDLEVTLSDHCFLPLSALKKLRQDAYKALADRMGSRYDRSAPGALIPLDDSPLSSRQAAGYRSPKSFQSTSLTSFPQDVECRVQSPAAQGGRESSPYAGEGRAASQPEEHIAWVYTDQLFRACLADDFYNVLCLPMDTWSACDLLERKREVLAAGKKAFLSLAAVMRQGRDQWEEVCLEPGWDGIYVHNINEAFWLASLGDYQGDRIAGASFYQWNSRSMRISHEIFGLDRFVLSQEPDFTKEGPIPAGPLTPEWLVYGRLPLMISAQCLKKNTGACDHKNGIRFLTDPSGRKLPVSNHCDYCYNKVWSHAPVDQIGWDGAGFVPDLRHYCFDFFLDDPKTPGRLSRRFLRWKESAGL